MVTLLESKLNSLPPEITSTYPNLVHQTINDVNPFFANKQENNVASNNQPVAPINNNNYNNNISNNINSRVENKVEIIEKEEEKNVDDSPESQLRNFVEENPSLEKFHKMLKYGIPTMAVEQKAKLEGTDADIIVVKLFFYNRNYASYIKKLILIQITNFFRLYVYF